MREIEARNRGGRRHRETAGQFDTGIFRRIQHIEQDRFQTMVGTGRIAGGRADALIFFPDQVLVVQILFGPVAPQVLADMFVHAFGKGFGQPVGQRFQQDAVIVILVHLEALDMFLDAVAGGDGKAADPVIFGVDEVGKTMVRFAAAFDDLLAQHRQGEFVILRRNENVVVFPPGAPETGHALGRQPFFIDNLVEHRLGITEQVAGAFADDLVGQNGGVIAGQFPRPEEWCPVDIVAQIREIPVLIDVQSRLCRRRRLETHVDLGCIGAGLFECRQFFSGLACPRDADLFIFFPGFGNKAHSLGVADQLGGDADRAAGIEHMDGRA